jgi:hypothetical protein
MSPETKNCQNCKNDFTIETDDFSFYEKMKVPPPTFCSECRMVRKLNWRSFRSLYRRACGLCNKNLISMYAPTDPAPVYCMECWNGDGWDPKSYGMEIDWTRPFLEQWFELFQKVPRLYAYVNGTLINSEFTNYTINNKDCYLSFSIIDCENVQYSEAIDKCRDSFDCLSVQELSQCSYNIDSKGNYNSHYLLRSQSCIDSYFLFDCTNCQNCCLSSNLRNQQYVFKNQKLSKEEYQKAVEDLHLDTYSGIEKAKIEFEGIRKNAVTKYAASINAQGSTGDFMTNVKNCTNTFDIYNSEDIKNSVRMLHTKDSRDCVGLLAGELEYEATACSVNSSRVAFSHICLTATDVRYSALSRSISDCFGCAGLKNSQYCILNKQYSKEEYKELIAKIEKQMDEMPYISKTGIIYKNGEYFPPDFCPFAYNECVGFDAFPLSKEEATKRGFRWKEREKRDYKTTLSSKDLPDSIKDIPDSILNETIECGNAGKEIGRCTDAFRITAPELDFLRQKGLPLPRFCPNCRHEERVKSRNPYKLWKRQCDCTMENHNHSTKCSNEFESAYSPERSEKVYCESCYQKAVL